MDIYKYYFLKLFKNIIFVLVFFALINYIIDPYQQFRISKFYDIYYGGNARYLLPGLIKNANYRDVVIGSSMVENFKISDVEHVLGYSNVIKLPLEGATSLEEKYILNSIFTNNNVTNNILYGLDFFSFSGSLTKTKINPFPSYMYSKTYYDKYQYLLNIDTLKECLMIPLRKVIKKNDPKYIYDTMFQWQHLYSKKDFSRKKLLIEWSKRNILYKQEYLSENYSIVNLVNHFEKHIYPYIKGHPNTKFTIFFPPYSMLTYKLMEEKHILDNIILFKKYLYGRLDERTNVSLYDFQLDANITNRLSNYRDIGHYSQEISLKILKDIQNNYNKVKNSTSYDKSLSVWKKDILLYKVKP